MRPTPGHRAGYLARCFVLVHISVMPLPMPTPEPIRRGRKKEDQEVFLSIGQAAALCGVTYQTFSTWRSSPNPPPEPKHGKISSIEIGDYIRERIRMEFADQGREGRLDATQQKARLQKAQADKAELDLAARQGELIEVEQVKAAGLDMVLRAKARFLRLPDSMTPLIIGQTDRATIQNILADGVRDALAELSVSWEGDGDDDNDGL